MGVSPPRIAFGVRAACIVASMTMGCSGGSADEAGSSGHDLIGGREALHGELPSSVLIQFSAAAGEGVDPGPCTGVAIGDHHLLTAAHCFDNLAIGAGARLLVYVGTTQAEQARHELRIVKKIPHPAWLAAVDASGGTSQFGEDGVPDVLVLDVERVVPREGGRMRPVLPVPAAKLADDPVQVGETVLFGGFGCEDDGATEPGAPRLKVARKTVRFVNASDAQVSKVEADGSESMACPGDSGGPVYRRAARGLEVVGINSFRAAELGMSAFARVDAEAMAKVADAPNAATMSVTDWIRGILAE